MIAPATAAASFERSRLSRSRRSRFVGETPLRRILASKTPIPRDQRDRQHAEADPAVRSRRLLLDHHPRRVEFLNLLRPDLDARRNLRLIPIRPRVERRDGHRRKHDRSRLRRPEPIAERPRPRLVARLVPDRLDPHIRPEVRRRPSHRADRPRPDELEAIFERLADPHRPRLRLGLDPDRPDASQERRRPPAQRRLPDRQSRRPRRPRPIAEPAQERRDRQRPGPPRDHPENPPSPRSDLADLRPVDLRRLDRRLRPLDARDDLHLDHLPDEMRPRRRDQSGRDRRARGERRDEKCEYQGFTNPSDLHRSSAAEAHPGCGDPSRPGRL